MVGESHGSCQTCRHRRDDKTCTLTNASLPETGGCCHWNVTLTEGKVWVTPAMVAPLAGFFEAAKEVLADFPYRVVGDEWLMPAEHIEALEALGVAYRLGPDGLWVEPERLVLVVEEPVVDILDRLDAPYLIEGNLAWIDPDELAAPATAYGQGTEL